MSALHELYIKRPGMKDGEEATDLICYNSHGRIVEWKIWSEYFHDWMETPVLTIKAQYPGAFERALDAVKADVNYHNEADGSDFRVDLARDEKSPA